MWYFIFEYSIVHMDITGINGTAVTAVIPKRPNIGCPPNTYGCIGYNCSTQQKQNCFCEEHCSWQICRLDKVPDECLAEVDGSWIWDATNSYWVAQITGEKKILYSNI